MYYIDHMDLFDLQSQLVKQTKSTSVTSLIIISFNGTSEAEYVYRLRKDFVPLRLQQDYLPDGWLGIMIGTRLYFDVHSEEIIDLQIPRLVKELRDRGKINPIFDTVDQGKSSESPFINCTILQMVVVSSLCLTSKAPKADNKIYICKDAETVSFKLYPVAESKTREPSDTVYHGGTAFCKFNYFKICQNPVALRKAKFV